MSFADYCNFFSSPANAVGVALNVLTGTWEAVIIPVGYFLWLLLRRREEFARAVSRASILQCRVSLIWLIWTNLDPYVADHGPLAVTYVETINLLSIVMSFCVFVGAAYLAWLTREKV